MMYYSTQQLIGNTPLVELGGFCKINNVQAHVAVKVEFFNPAGSVKDRAALEMINDAEARGLLKPGSVIIEPTSGNTGIGLALIAKTRGYRLVLTMPETMSIERRKLLAAYGAELVLTSGTAGMAGAVAKAKMMLETVENSFMPDQFSNPANVAAHYKTTGPEIWEQTEGKIDAFVAGIGTGGTITGIGRYLKEKNPEIKIIGVEPSDSAVLTGGKAGPHKLQGIGAGFIPAVLDMSVVDRVIPVTAEAAYRHCRTLPQSDGLLVGISSGAALEGAVQLSHEDSMRGKNIVVLLPDGGDRYLSGDLFEA